MLLRLTVHSGTRREALQHLPRSLTEVLEPLLSWEETKKHKEGGEGRKRRKQRKGNRRKERDLPQKGSTNAARSTVPEMCFPVSVFFAVLPQVTIF